MKYIEQIKSLLLTFLVTLSVVFTLLIWNYKPEYETIKETQVEEELVGQSKELQEVLKPYRLLYRQNEQFSGTVATATINEFYSQLRTWEIYDLDLVDTELSNIKMNDMLRKDNRVTMFFNEEMPLQVFSSLLSFNDNEIPEASFTRLIVDWSNIEKNGQLQILFLNTEKRLLYSAYAGLPDKEYFMKKVIEPANGFSQYVEVERDNLRSLYVAKDPIQSSTYTYLVDPVSVETSVSSFKKILFTDLKIVKPNNEGPQSERFTDGTSLMTVDNQNRIINYVHPPAESIAPISSSKLLIDSFNFVNDHGGFTQDFRLSYMNIGKHITEYQLFVQGYPVHSEVTTTRLATTWGENRIFRYRRPYYSIGSFVKSTQRELDSGEQIIESLRTENNELFKESDEIVVGYQLTQNADVIVLNPSWFAITNNVWKPLTPKEIGGVEVGLE
ncbi:two-component system activity regulator YycH [Solibacillus sp. FSL W7-1464]|uniref:YycH family regulatory protein n=1 Tax=Solibacillus sp. FSL W7-1464 TaxID=2921706 RepID=UPI0030FAE4B7